MNFHRLLAQSLRMTLRDWRAGELRLLAAALVVAVAAVTSVGFLVDRIRLGLERDATQLLGADLVLSSDTPIGADQAGRANAAKLQIAQTVTFPSMAISADDADRSSLSAVKAVSPGYPLRGNLRVADAIGQEDRVTREIPARGEVWVDGQLLQAIGAKPGDALKLGEKTFRISKIIAIEPDRGTQFINFAPRVMLNIEDLAATQLIANGSRVTYRLLVAGERPAVRTYSESLQQGLQRGQRIETLEGGRPEMQRTIDRAERFLALVALLAAMIAAVAVAAAARRFSLRHLDSCAMMRCLGLAQADIFRLFALEFVVIGLAACIVGMALGYATHYVLLNALGSLIRTTLPQPSLLPGAQGFACGLVLLLGFALPPLAQLRHVPPLRVLRKDVGLPTGRVALGYLAGLIGFFALLLWSSNDLKIGSLTAGGFAGGLVVFALVAWGVLKLLAPLRALTGKLGISWRFAIAAVQRRPVATIIQLVSLAVGLMALLLLTVTRTDLVDAWRKAAPPDAPNRFVVNIQPDQATRCRCAVERSGCRRTAASDDSRPIDRSQRPQGRPGVVYRRSRATFGRSRIQSVVHGRCAVAQSHHRRPLVCRRQQRAVDRGRHRRDTRHQARRRADVRYRRAARHRARDQPAQSELGFDACKFLRHHAAVAAERHAGELHQRVSFAGQSRRMSPASCCSNFRI